MTKDEALDLALETLESIQAAFPCETVGKRITAIKQARALDKKADNARELGLDCEPDAYGYAKRLAEAIWKKHYKSTAPHWRPFDHLIGVLTQIDNMTSGLIAPPAHPAPVQKPVVFYRCNGCGHAYEEQHPTSCDCMEGGGFKRVDYYTTPPTQPAPVQEPLAGCACRWDHDDNRVITCERHQGWLEVIAEWADRAREAEAKLKDTPSAQPAFDLQAELEATNRQVEILSDALAESRREVAQLKAQSAPVQEPLTDEHIERIYHRYGGNMINCARAIERAVSAAQRQWVGLTDEEIKPFCDENHIIYGAYTVDFIHAIETKLKEKNT